MVADPWMLVRVPDAVVTHADDPPSGGARNPVYACSALRSCMTANTCSTVIAVVPGTAAWFRDVGPC